MSADEQASNETEKDIADSQDRPAVDSLSEEVPRVQIVRYWPGSWFWWALPFLFVGVAVLGYQLGAPVGPTLTPLERLEEQREAYNQDRMDELRAELTELRMMENVDNVANNDVRASFRELQSKIVTLEEEVSFYRSLMAPEELAKGLRIEKMLVKSTERPSVYGYQLVIAQTVARHAWQEGELYFEVHGAVAGERAVLALTEIATIPEYPLGFKFRYFQNYTGELTLPADFTPEVVIVTLDRGGAGEIVQERFDWSA